MSSMTHARRAAAQRGGTLPNASAQIDIAIEEAKREPHRGGRRYVRRLRLAHVHTTGEDGRFVGWLRWPDGVLRTVGIRSTIEDAMRLAEQRHLQIWGW